MPPGLPTGPPVTSTDHRCPLPVPDDSTKRSTTGSERRNVSCLHQWGPCRSVDEENGKDPLPSTEDRDIDERNTGSGR